MNERAKNKIVLVAISFVCLALAVLISIKVISDIYERINPSSFVVPPSDNSIVKAVIGVLLSMVMSVMSAIAAFSNKFYDKIMQKSSSSTASQIGNEETVAPELEITLASGRLYISRNDRPLCWAIAIASAIVTFALGYLCFTQFSDAQHGLRAAIPPIFLLLILPIVISLGMTSIIFFIGAVSQRFFDKFLASYFRIGEE